MHSKILCSLQKCFATAFVLCALLAQAQVTSTLAPQDREKIDKAAREVLAATGVPSASIAVVKNGRIAYLQAYGDARVQPTLPARSDMRYSIGSISKQFTAAAILMLAEEGKLSLDDPVGRFVPNLTRANEVSIRQILSHTSGYQDYWPQDYVMPNVLLPTTAEQIMDAWARKPLDFDPGTQWQYSNTGYVIAGVIVEKAGGMPLLDFLQRRIFEPLGMRSVINVDQGKLSDTDPAGYLRYALGPPRPAPKEGQGWMFAAGELAMTAQDLAKWDVSMLEQRLLKPDSYKEMETEVKLKNGQGTNYGLGVSVRGDAKHRVISHGGEVSGFTAQNTVLLDDQAAVVVLTNQDAAGAAGQIVGRIRPLIVGGGEANQKLEQARRIYEGLQRGKIDRSLFTGNANSYFTEQALQDFASSLGPLGAPQDFSSGSQSLRGGMTFRSYRVKYPQKTLVITIYEMPDGKLEQYMVAAAE